MTVKFQGSLKQITTVKFPFVMFVVYVIVFTIFSILKHYNLHSFAYDLGIFLQSLWNTIHGRFFYETPDLYWNPTGNYLSVHFSVIMLFLVPLYFVLPNAEFLLFFQSFLLGLAGLPLYFLCKKVTGNDAFAKILTVSYYLSPILHAANLYDFHVESFLPLLIFSSLYYLEKGALRKSLLFIIAICFCLYTLCPFAILLLLFHVVRLRSFNKTLIASLLGIISYYILVSRFVLPALGNIPFQPGTITWFPFLGRSWMEILNNVIKSPALLIKSVLYDAQPKITYWVLISLPVLFLYLLYPPSLIPLSYWLVISLLTSYEPFYTIGWQYVLIPIPIIYAGAVYGFRSLLKIKINISKKIIKVHLIISLAQLIFSPISPLVYGLQIRGGGGYDNVMSFPPRYYSVKQALDLIKQDDRAVILTTNNLFPHLANSPYVFIWLPKEVIPDYIVVDIKDFSRLYDKIGNITFIEQLERLLSNHRYDVYALKGGILILKLNYHGKPKFYEPFSVRVPSDRLFSETLSKATILEDGFRTILRGTIKSASKPVWFGPYMLLPPGEYHLELRLKTSDKCFKKIYVELTSNFGKKRLGSFNLVSGETKLEHGWQTMKILFKVVEIEKHVEIRGWGPENCEIALAYLRIYGPLRKT